MILIIDNGSQYTHLIKRNCRDMDLEAEIIGSRISLDEIIAKNPEKIILSGGPSSVYAPEEQEKVGAKVVKAVFEGRISIPLLGICFGHQIIGHFLGGEVKKGKNAEYGIAKIIVDKEGVLLKGVPKEFNAWVSHFDEIVQAPPGFEVLAHSSTCKAEAMENNEKRIYSVQFHPEVWHTEHGELILQNFLRL
ncbi:glutamine-hydrolyzing GMP synthase [Candidatus Micrarchaeota archaeon]|nr:glutamine-hydrolyzing GMP synthase [Candidatus Micrarchaeota archaeon]